MKLKLAIVGALVATIGTGCTTATVAVSEGSATVKTTAWSIRSMKKFMEDSHKIVRDTCGNYRLYVSATPDIPGLNEHAAAPTLEPERMFGGIDPTKVVEFFVETDKKMLKHTYSWTGKCPISL